MKYQANEPCTACGTTRQQRCYHHVTSRGAGGSDEPNNLMPLCFKCHEEIHRGGVGRMISKYYSVYKWLKDMERDDIFEKIGR